MEEDEGEAKLNPLMEAFIAIFSEKKKSIFNTKFEKKSQKMRPYLPIPLFLLDGDPLTLIFVPIPPMRSWRPSTPNPQFQRL